MKNDPVPIVFYKNYDYGLGEYESGPGTGLYQNMDQYKSVDDFLERKRLRKKKRLNRRKKLLAMIKNAIDFSIDDQINSTPIIGDTGAYSDSVYIGGIYDRYMPYNDFEGKTVEQLDFGRDYTDDEKPYSKVENESLTPKEVDFFGVSNSIPDEEDLEEITYNNSYYGILGNNRL